jgi:hypothetical protein
MIEIRFDKTKDEVALLIWFLVDHSVYKAILFLIGVSLHTRTQHNTLVAYIIFLQYDCLWTMELCKLVIVLQIAIVSFC